MPLFRTSFLIWLLGASVLVLVAAPAPAQVDPVGENSAEVEKKPPTSWPPKNAQKHEIKRTSQAQGLILYTPSSWKKDDSQNEARLAEFSISGSPQPVTLRVFSFENEKAGGGGVQANIERWTNQFEEVREKNIWTGAARKEESQDRLYVLVDLKGSYKLADQQVKDARMLAAIIGLRWNEEQAVNGKKETVQKSAVYFLEMVGPEKTVTANEQHFRQAFGAVDQENELTDNQEAEETSSN
jgi:hypothetical protein